MGWQFQSLRRRKLARVTLTLALGAHGGKTAVSRSRSTLNWQAVRFRRSCTLCARSRRIAWATLVVSFFNTWREASLAIFIARRAWRSSGGWTLGWWSFRGGPSPEWSLSVCGIMSWDCSIDVGTLHGSRSQENQPRLLLAIYRYLRRPGTVFFGFP